MRREEGKPRLGGFDVGVFFSDSYNSPAYRVSSTGVVFKPSRGAAALSSAATLTGRFISPEICTDHTSLMANCQSVSRSCRALSSITLPPPHPPSPFLLLHLLLLLLQGQETFFFFFFFSLRRKTLSLLRRREPENEKKKRNSYPLKSLFSNISDTGRK